jgi:hypothetical protein
MSTTDAVVRFRFFRWYGVAISLLYGAALYLSFYAGPLAVILSFLLIGLSMLFCIVCPRCGKSPYVLYRGGLRIGVPIPERVCSKCAHDAIAADPPDRANRS